MTRTVVVYGPKGCGKTTNAEALRQHFGCESIFDDWVFDAPYRLGGLLLTCEPTEEMLKYDCSKPGLEIHSFVEACELAGIPARPNIKPDDRTSKATNPNPKDAVGSRKWRQFTPIPLTVMAEVGVGMLEGAAKYGKHNYRVAGVRASIYADAAIGHITQWQEGEDLDPDSLVKNSEGEVVGGLSHITKAICSLVVLRDAMIQGKLYDDRPPKGKLCEVRDNLQRVVDSIFEKYPEPKRPFTEAEHGKKTGEVQTELAATGNLS